MLNHIPLISTILGGGFILGAMQDRINILCEDNNNLKNDHKILREKIYDIHLKVCNIDNKINNLLEK
jgi:hypothetical protein